MRYNRVTETGHARKLEYGRSDTGERGASLKNSRSSLSMQMEEHKRRTSTKLDAKQNAKAANTYRSQSLSTSLSHFSPSCMLQITHQSRVMCPLGRSWYRGLWDEKARGCGAFMRGRPQEDSLRWTRWVTEPSPSSLLQIFSLVAKAPCNPLWRRRTRETPLAFCQRSSVQCAEHRHLQEGTAPIRRAQDITWVKGTPQPVCPHADMLPVLRLVVQQECGADASDISSLPIQDGSWITVLFLFEEYTGSQLTNRKMQ